MLNENFLKYVWRHRYFSTPDLKTVCGKHLHVLNPGLENHTDGPDFSVASIKLDDISWIGHAELHVNASDWYRHNHHEDSKYNNVILHVVYNADTEVDINGQPIPTIELKNYIPEDLVKRYQALTTNNGTIPCSQNHFDVPNIIKSAFLDRVFIGRLEQKVELIQKDYIQNKLSLAQVFYKWIGQTLGQKNNVFGFELLCQYLPIEVLLKYQSSVEDIEALLFGVAGFLQNPVDFYSEKLAKRFVHLQYLYKLEVIDRIIWNYKGVRPSGFPTIRIAFLASFIRQWNVLFKAGLNFKEIKNPIGYTKLIASSYWDSHYVFGKESKFVVKQAGSDLRHRILVNCMLPFFYFYSKRTGAANYEFLEKVYQTLPAEDNTVTRKMAESGFVLRNAKDAQTLMGLYKNYCSHKKCLRCGIGHALLK